MGETHFTAEEIDTIRKMAAREGADAIREKCEEILKEEVREDSKGENR